MTYIREKYRTELDAALRSLFDHLRAMPEEQMVGHLNYCYSVLAFRLFDDARSYHRANAITGVFVSAQ